MLCESMCFMSNSLPPNSPSPQQSSSRTNDEWIAVVVALLAMGSIFFWVVGRDTRPFAPRWASPTVAPAPSRVSRPINLSQIIEQSIRSHRTPTTAPEAVSQPITPSRVPSPAPSTRTTAPRTASTQGVSPAAGITPFFFAPSEAPEAADSPDSDLTIVPVPVEEPTATQPETEASPQPEPQAVQPQPEALAPVPLVLSDVPEDYWARGFIESTSEREIILPYADGSFQPDQPVTRAELARKIENAFISEEDKSGELKYTDVDPDTWAKQAITDVTQTGFMTGYPGDLFLPNQPVPRVQVLVALVSGLNLQAPDNPEETIQVYQDADQIPQWAIEKIAAATKAGLVVNHPETNTLNPNQPATRAEVSAMIYQALVKSGQAEPIESDYLVQPNQ